MHYSDKPHVVVKPSVGQGTIGVCICKDIDELKDAITFNKDVSFNIDPDEDTKLIIQEYIGGEEYVVNSICCKGHNRIISASVYNKILREGRGAIYDTEYTIDESHPHFKELAEYNDKVLSALGLEYGAVHGEYKLDENGPVLIEMNCRVPGPTKRYSLIDSVLGEHTTALSLESYLNPEECIKKSNKPLKYLTNFVIKDIVINEDIDVIKPTFEEAFKDLESYADSIPIFTGEHFYPKTIDLFTSGGFIFLTNTDEAKLSEDIETIRRMEKYEIGKIFELK